MFAQHLAERSVTKELAEALGECVNITGRYDNPARAFAVYKDIMDATRTRRYDG
jgi:hypothetical protein